MPTPTPRLSPQVPGRINPTIVHFTLIILAASFVYCLVFSLPFTPFFYYSDQLFGMSGGQQILEGHVLYKDFWDFIFPGTHVFYAAAFAIFGTKYWIASATIILIGVVTFWLTLSISKKVIDGPMYLLPAITYLFFGYRWFGLDGYHRMFSPIFILITIWILLNGTKLRNCVLAGIACAMAAFFTQQRGVFALAAALLFIILDSKISREEVVSLIGRLSAACLGFSVTILVLCGYFIYQAGLIDFFYWTVIYPAKYNAYAPMNNPGVYLQDWEKTLALSSVSGKFAVLPVLLYTVITPLATLAAAGLFLFKRNVRISTWRKPLVCVIFGTALLFSSTGPSPSRLFQIAAPSLIVLFWLIDYFVRSASVKKMISYAVIASLLVLGFVQALRIQTHWDNKIWKTPTGDLVILDTPGAKPYALFSKVLSPGDYYFDPIGTNLVFPLQIHNPTRFFQIWDTEITRPEMVAEAVADLRRNPPKYIVWYDQLSKPAEERAPGDHLAPLYEFLITNYEPFSEPYDEDISTRLWRRKDVPDPE